MMAVIMPLKQSGYLNFYYTGMDSSCYCINIQYSCQTRTGVSALVNMQDINEDNRVMYIHISLATTIVLFFILLIVGSNLSNGYIINPMVSRVWHPLSGQFLAVTRGILMPEV